MSKIFAIIENGYVSSLALSYKPLEENWVEVDRSVKVGYGYDGTNFINRDTELKIAEERKWRDEELKSTDYMVPITDHPQHSLYINYRQALRDYPSQEGFPNGTRPSLEEI